MTQHQLYQHDTAAALLRHPSATVTPANPPMVAPHPRRAMLGGTVAGASALATPSSSSTAAGLSASFNELDAKINAGMKAYAIPGVAVAVWAGGQEYVKGYGVTNVDHPVPVDGDTIFRIGSTTKTFTGTTMMRLVEQGKV